MKNEEVSMESRLIALTKQMLIESGELHQREITLNSYLGMDSLSLAELFKRIEKTFNVSLPDHLLAESDTLNNIFIFLYHTSPSNIKHTPKRIVTPSNQNAPLELSSAQSLVDILLLYAEKYPDKPHIHFQSEDGQEVITYGELLRKSLQVAKGLTDRGLFEGDCVAIMQPTTPDFFYTFFGTLLAGGVPVPIYPPFRKNMLEAYAKTESRILKSAEVRMLVTFKKAETLSRLLQSFVPSLKHVVTASDLMGGETLSPIFYPKSNHYGLIQYTSGSTSDPKGVLLTHGNLLANIRGYGKAIQIRPDEVAVSWLPLYHDLGLIGMWLGSLYHGAPLVLMTPFSFLNRPERWLWAIHYHRGTISGAPNFAYELCIRQFDPALYEGLDLSSWRVAANGAEKIYPKTLEQFATLFAPYGFKRETLLPVYGLAESCVGLTIPTPGLPYRIDKVDRKKFEEKSRAEVSITDNILEFVGCGKPLEGHEVRIVDNDNNVLGERQVGTLQFKGPSSMQGYYNNPKATQDIFHDGWIDSGDLAYIADGDIFITGRRKDLIVKAGRNLYPVEIEEYVSAVPGVRKGCVAVFSVLDERRGTEQLIIVAETKNLDKIEQEKISEAITETIARLLDVVPDHVVMVPPHRVPKTSSGKLQRAACKKMYLEGKLNQSPIPAWMQVARLGLASTSRKTGRWLFKAAKTFYTLYVFMISLISVMTAYLFLFILPRKTAAKFCRNLARLVLRIIFCPLEIKNAEKLQQQDQVIYTANHASYIDSIVLMAILSPNTLFVAKKELMDTMIFKTFMKKLNYLPVDRIDFTKGLEDTDQIMRALKKGSSIAIFPEGTFGYGSGLRPFRLGAFKLAVEANIPICPIALKGTRAIWRGEEKLIWPGKIIITVCDFIYAEGKEWRDVTTLRNAVREEIAKHCGEPSLDLIAAQSIAEKNL